jgi:hypothetical protein
MKMQNNQAARSGRIKLDKPGREIRLVPRASATFYAGTCRQQEDSMDFNMPF